MRSTTPHEPAFRHVRAANRLIGQVRRRVERRERIRSWWPSPWKMVVAGALFVGACVWVFAAYGFLTFIGRLT